MRTRPSTRPSIEFAHSRYSLDVGRTVVGHVDNGGLTVLQSGLKSKHFPYISHGSEHTEIHVIISIKQQVHSFKSFHMKSYVKRNAIVFVG